MSVTPIFVSGFDRSGTTIIKKVLGTHNKIGSSQ